MTLIPELDSVLRMIAIGLNAPLWLPLASNAAKACVNVWLDALVPLDVAVLEALVELAALESPSESPDAA